MAGRYGLKTGKACRDFLCPTVYYQKIQRILVAVKKR